MNIVTVTMTSTVPGSPDGLRVQEYVKGKRYDIPEDLATNFIAGKAAQVFKTPETPETPEGASK